MQWISPLWRPPKLALMSALHLQLSASPSLVIKRKKSPTHLVRGAALCSGRALQPSPFESDTPPLDLNYPRHFLLVGSHGKPTGHKVHLLRDFHPWLCFEPPPGPFSQLLCDNKAVPSLIHMRLSCIIALWICHSFVFYSFLTFERDPRLLNVLCCYPAKRIKLSVKGRGGNSGEG